MSDTEVLGVTESEYVEVEEVEIHSGFDQDTAVLLLAEAEKAGYDVSVVRTISEGFAVPRELAEAAGVEYVEPDAVQPAAVASYSDEELELVQPVPSEVPGTVETAGNRAAEAAGGDSAVASPTAEADGPEFSSKAEAQKYAKKHKLQIAGASKMSADDYKKAVAKAARKGD